VHYLAGGGNGETPLDADEAAGLIPTWVSTVGDRNRAEERNIAVARLWLRERQHAVIDILDEPFLRELHRRMFGRVWRWAGTYRTTAKNIGIDALRIPETVAQLIGDAQYWSANATFPPFERAVRFHHKLVLIHAFPNGNGRHARIAAELLARAEGADAPTWGAGNRADARDRYLRALREADRGEFAELLRFAAS
jgi:Fic-DOC domain mobile mystery protein B